MAETIKPVEGVAYTANTFDDILVAMLGAVNYNPATMAPLRYNPFGRNTLAVSGATSPVAVASGDAIVNGKHYTNTASKNITVSTPAAATRIDRVVLRIDYTASPMTCEAVLLAGAEGGAAPALTQTDGTTWEVSLAQVSITTGGDITLTDERVYVGQRTRTFWVPANAIFNATDSVAVTSALYTQYKGWVFEDAHVYVAYGSFTVPPDCIGGLTAQPYGISNNAGDVNTYQIAYGGAVGEVFNTHSAANAEGAHAVTGAYNVEDLDTALALTDFAAGDMVMLQFYNDAVDAAETSGGLYFQGWQISYTAYI